MKWEREKKKVTEYIYPNGMLNRVRVCACLRVSRARAGTLGEGQFHALSWLYFDAVVVKEKYIYIIADAIFSRCRLSFFLFSFYFEFQVADTLLKMRPPKFRIYGRRVGNRRRRQPEVIRLPCCLFHARQQMKYFDAV